MMVFCGASLYLNISVVEYTEVVTIFNNFTVITATTLNNSEFTMPHSSNAFRI